MSIEKVTIQATINAPKTIVWEKYTQPEHIINWNFANDDWSCPTASNDIRVGGKYMARMEAKDGSFGFDFEAIYDEVIIGQHYTFTMGDTRKVAVDFKENAHQTTLTIVFDAETENDVEMQKAGWQAILNNFKKYIES